MATPDSTGDHPPDYHTVVHRDHPNELPPSYDKALSGDGALKRKEAVQEYRVEYRSGPPHVNYGITLKDGHIHSVEPGSTAAQSEVTPGGRILVLNGVNHRHHTQLVIAQHMAAEYERYSALTVLLGYPSLDCAELNHSIDEIQGTPQTQTETQCIEFSVDYKPGSFDADYGLSVHEGEVTAVRPGTVSSLAGVKAGGRVVKVNEVDLRSAANGTIHQQLTTAYQQRKRISLTVEYTELSKNLAFFKNTLHFQKDIPQL